MKNVITKIYAFLFIILAISPLYAGKNQIGKNSKNKNDNDFLNTLIQQKENNYADIIGTLTKHDAMFTLFLQETGCKEKKSSIVCEHYKAWINSIITLLTNKSSIFLNISSASDTYTNLLRNNDEYWYQSRLYLETLLEKLNLTEANSEQENICVICSKILKTAKNLTSNEKLNLKKYNSYIQKESLDDLEQHLIENTSLIESLNRSDNYDIANLSQYLFLMKDYLISLNSLPSKQYDLKQSLQQATESLFFQKELLKIFPSLHNETQKLYTLLCKADNMLVMDQIENDYVTKINTLACKIYDSAMLIPTLKKSLAELEKHIMSMSFKPLNTPTKQTKNKELLLKKGSTKQQHDEFIPLEEVTCVPKIIEYEIKPTQPPYTSASHHVLLWLSGKEYEFEALSRFKIRYGYDYAYMQKNKDNIIKSHTIPVEIDGYIAPLAKKDPCLDPDGTISAWRYTIPGYFEDCTTNTRQRGLFTWGVNLNGQCFHRGFTIREDRELFKTMSMNEDTKNLLMDESTSQISKNIFEKPLNTLPTIEQNSWDVIVHDKEQRTTAYLSKCIYKTLLQDRRHNNL